MNYLERKNSENQGRWRWKWHLQGGSSSWSARPLQDLRNEEGHRRYRMIEHLRRCVKHGRRTAKVINLTHERFERVRRKVEENARKVL